MDGALSNSGRYGGRSSRSTGVAMPRRASGGIHDAP